MEAFNSVPWKAFPSSAEPKAWHKHRVPYTSSANALQNLDIWIPSTSSSSSLSLSEIPSRPGVWVVYIHGGAWRDPLVDSSSFSETVSKLTVSPASILGKISGFASLNYTLSPHPAHPTHPAPPKDPNQPIDSSRTAVHPQHITDILTGLSFLNDLTGMGSNYILLGHSCGATLALQVVMDRERWGTEAALSNAPKPQTIVGLNGLYDLVGFINNPDESHAPLGPIYEAFTRNAFGDEKSVWVAVSPTTAGVQYWSKEWEVGKKVRLCQSREDKLVPYSQIEGIKQLLGRDKKLVIEEVDATGDHNGLWEKGDRLAEIILQTVGDQA